MIQFRTGMFLQTKGEADAKLIPLYGETELGLKYSWLVFFKAHCCRLACLPKHQRTMITEIYHLQRAKRIEIRGLACGHCRCCGV